MDQILFLLQKGDYLNAKKQLLMLIANNPGNVQGWNLLGIVSHRLGEMDDAIQAFQKSSEIDPENFDSYNNQGVLFLELGKNHDALNALQHALRIEKSNASAWCNLAQVQGRLGKTEEAIRSAQTALSVKPNYPSALNVLSAALLVIGLEEDAQKYLERALALDPSLVEAKVNLSKVCFLKEDYSQSFDLYESRWATKDFENVWREDTKEIWKGQRTDSVLLWAEQGLGDEVMFASIFNDVAHLCDKVIVECDERLIRLFSRSFGNQFSFVKRGSDIDRDAYQFQLPVGSLPQLFRRNSRQFTQNQKKYLIEPERDIYEIEEIKKERISRPVVGLSWRTTNKAQDGVRRNIDLVDVVRALGDMNLEMVSLQYGDVGDEIKRAQQQCGSIVSEINQIDCFSDIDGLAALISQCDHVITIDNSTAHLAGALGKRSSVLLPLGHEWRWGSQTDSVPWYSSITPFRNKNAESWDDVLEAVCTYLKPQLASG